VPAIALTGVTNGRGTWLCFDLATGREFTAEKWVSLPMPDSAIERLNGFYDADEHTGLKKDQRVKKTAERKAYFEELVEEAVAATPTKRADIATMKRAKDTVIAHVEDTVMESVEEYIDLDELEPVTDVEDNDDTVVTASKLTIARALREEPELSRAAIAGEINQLLSKLVYAYVRRHDMSEAQRRAVIRSSMFLRKKFTAEGLFEKIKARLVAGGDGQDKTLFENLSSPTVSQDSVMLVLAIAAAEKRKLASIDITAAYLEVVLPDDHEVYMYFDGPLAKMVESVDPIAKKYMEANGRIYVKLKKALYGCVQSSKLWFELLSKVLVEFGMKANEHDACVFNKTSEKGVQITIAFHVDDLLVTCTDSSEIQQLVEHLKSNFEKISLNMTNVHSYLSMTIVESDENLTVSMLGYVDKCIEGKSVRGVNSPATDRLFEIGIAPPLDVAEKEGFHSQVAKLLYLAKRTRMDILTTVSFLASRVSTPTADDQEKLDRVLGYLLKTRNLKTVFARGEPVLLEAYVDASFGCHHDATSRTGIVLMMSNAAIASWSSKQKLVAKSSTEAEIVGLSDAMTQILWAREWLVSQGYDPGAIKVYQDNMGVMSLMKTGKSTSHRTKYLKVRDFFAKSRADAGEVKFQWCPTEDMIADLMTKAVQGKLFTKLRGQLTGLDVNA